MKVSVQHWPSIVCGLVTFIGISASPALATDRNAIFAHLFNQFEIVNSVEMHATSRMVCNNHMIDSHAPNKTTDIQTIFTYTAEGDKYNIIASSDPAAAPNWDFRDAFNGERFQLLNRTDKHLAIKKGDRPRHGLLFTNPFFAPFEFLSLTSDQLDSYAVELKRVKNPQVQKAAIASAQWRDAPGGDAVATLPGTVLNHRSFAFQLYFHASEFTPYRVVRAYSDDKGGIIDDTQITYQNVMIKSGPLVAVPKVIHRISYADSGDGVYSDDQETITECKLNVPVDERVFTIDFKGTKSIYDLDTYQYLSKDDMQRPVQQVVGISTDDSQQNAWPVVQSIGVARHVGLVELAGIIVAVIGAGLGIAWWLRHRGMSGN